MAKPTLLADPHLCPGAYTLDAYCKYEFDDHGWHEFPHQFVEQTSRQCAKKAKSRGWILHRDRTATCPKCAKALRLGKYRGAA